MKGLVILALLGVAALALPTGGLSLGGLVLVPLALAF